MADNFVFYSSWVEFLYRLPRETAKEVLWQIMKVGLGEEMDTTDPLIEGVILGMVLPNIKCAKSRYAAAVENGKKGGRPAKQIDMDQVFDLLNQGKTYQQIADVMGVSRNTIANRIQEHKKQKPETKTNKQLDIDIDNDNRKVSAANPAETTFDDQFLDDLLPCKTYYDPNDLFRRHGF